MREAVQVFEWCRSCGTGTEGDLGFQWPVHCSGCGRWRGGGGDLRGGRQHESGRCAVTRRRYLLELVKVDGQGGDPVVRSYGLRCVVCRAVEPEMAVLWPRSGTTRAERWRPPGGAVNRREVLRSLIQLAVFRLRFHRENGVAVNIYVAPFSRDPHFRKIFHLLAVGCRQPGGHFRDPVRVDLISRNLKAITISDMWAVGGCTFGNEILGDHSSWRERRICHQSSELGGLLCRKLLS